jgi:3-deoxy-D-manno-octulosonate 8-phosphate phosphatase (KDO 8-P phosphatase)
MHAHIDEDMDGELLAEAREKAKNIRLMIFDADGVLTDGAIYVGEGGELFKAFDARDGLGISLWKHLGGDAAIITGRESKMLALRAARLGIDKVYQGSVPKIETYRKLKEQTGYRDEEIAYIGDDLIDLPVMRQAGLALAVGDAVHEVCDVADVIASCDGGRGAVRELLEFVLKAQGKWEQALRMFAEDGGPAVPEAKQ